MKHALFLFLVGLVATAAADDFQVVNYRTMTNYIQTVNEGRVTVAWTFATNNVDGTPLTDLAGAKVYWGLSSSNYTHIVDVPGGEPGGEGRCTVSNLVVGTRYYFNGTAYNILGLESDFTDEVSKVATTNTFVRLNPPRNVHFVNEAQGHFIDHGAQTGAARWLDDASR